MSAPRRYWPFVMFIVLVYAVGSSGSIFTDTGPWYQSLRKPFFTPPNWVIPVVWNILFLLIAVSGGLMYFQTGRRRFFTAYGVNLVLNFLWSLIFFGLRSPQWAFAELAVLWLSIAVLIALAWRSSRLAAWCLVPYLVWVSFAGGLNFFIAFM